MNIVKDYGLFILDTKNEDDKKHNELLWEKYEEYYRNLDRNQKKND